MLTSHVQKMIHKSSYTKFFGFLVGIFLFKFLHNNIKAAREARNDEQYFEKIHNQSMRGLKEKNDLWRLRIGKKSFEKKISKNHESCQVTNRENFKRRILEKDKFVYQTSSSLVRRNVEPLRQMLFCVG